MKTIFCLLLAHHLFTALPRTCKVFTICFKTCCQTVTPLLNSTCMMLWSGVANSGKSMNNVNILLAVSF